MRGMANCLLIGLLAVAAGCGSDLPETVKINGKVTFDGQAPPKAGIVYFLPTEAAAGFPSRPGTGEFDKAASSPSRHLTRATD